MSSKGLKTHHVLSPWYVSFFNLFFFFVTTYDYLGLSKITKGVGREGKRVGARDASRLKPGYVFFFLLLIFFFFFFFTTNIYLVQNMPTNKDRVPTLFGPCHLHFST